jgi:hypothetical protein
VIVEHLWLLAPHPPHFCSNVATEIDLVSQINSSANSPKNNLHLFQYVFGEFPTEIFPDSELLWQGMCLKWQLFGFHFLLLSNFSFDTNELIYLIARKLIRSP